MAGENERAKNELHIMNLIGKTVIVLRAHFL